jgi:hypothetical protein
VRFNVRRLAAVDVHGAAGTRTRARIIVAEFVLGALVSIGLGVFLFASLDGLGWRIFALWLIGIGLNYVPLAIYAIRFFPPGAATAELESVDLTAELKYYTATQI